MLCSIIIIVVNARIRIIHYEAIALGNKRHAKNNNNKKGYRLTNFHFTVWLKTIQFYLIEKKKVQNKQVNPITGLVFQTCSPNCDYMYKLPKFGIICMSMHVLILSTEKNGVRLGYIQSYKNFALAMVVEEREMCCSIFYMIKIEQHISRSSTTMANAKFLFLGETLRMHVGKGKRTSESSH